MANEPSPVIRRRVQIRGRVQRVFFRDSCRAEAERLGVGGSIENLEDGSVLGHFEGNRAAVEALIEWCQHGPPKARVESVEVSDEHPEGAVGFLITGAA